MKEEGADIERYGLEGYFKKSITRLEGLRGGDGVSKNAGYALDIDGAESDCLNGIATSTSSRACLGWQRLTVLWIITALFWFPIQGNTNNALHSL